ncbi:MerR family transcriptional regulator [Roseomonas sp. F4]
MWPPPRASRRGPFARGSRRAFPAPLNRGPAARYPADTLERVLAIRAMRDVLGMPLAEIRKELLVGICAEIGHNDVVPRCSKFPLDDNGAPHHVPVHRGTT